MKNLFFKPLVGGIFIILLISSLAWGNKLNVQTLNKIIQSRKKRWVARQTSKAGLSLEEKRALCGLLGKRMIKTRHDENSREPISPDATYLRAKSFLAKGSYSISGSIFSAAEAPETPVAEGPVVQLPSYFDWRSKDRRDWTTPIRNQGACGSCWAHASVAVMEAMMKIGLKDTDLYPDYSEQFMVSCSGGGCDGWFMDNSAAFLKSIGVPPEECFPYQAQDVPCENRCPDWENQIEKIPDWNWVSGVPQVVQPSVIKQKLMKGPLLVAMTVYDDFMYYSRGAYEHVQGNTIGEHAVVIVGWNDNDHSWICKNSWGLDWGDSGWFRIKMGQNECGIESSLIYFTSPIDWSCDLEEDFENQSGLPQQWERRVQNAKYSWGISTSPVYEGSQAASVEYDPDLHSQDEVLMSWPIKGSDLSVAFAFMGSYYWSVEQKHYKVSLWAVPGAWDGGEDDDILISKNILKDHLQFDDESWTWTPVRYSLPPTVDNIPFRLAFRYQGTDGAQFCLDKVCVQGLQSVGCACTMEDSGSLDIGQGTEFIPIRIQKAPQQVRSFGYDIIYDSSLTSYLGFEVGNIFKNFDFCACQEINPGQIRCGGSNASLDGGGKNISAGYSGTVVTLQFSPLSHKREKCSLCLENLMDDMSGWETTNGCLLPSSSCPADVNGDGQISPQDALCIYEKSLNVCPTSSCGSCSDICCDLDMDGECTSADAMLIFKEYLSGQEKDSPLKAEEVP